MDFAGYFIEALHIAENLRATGFHCSFVFGRKRCYLFGGDLLFEHSVNCKSVFYIRAADLVVNLAYNKV